MQILIPIIVFFILCTLFYTLHQKTLLVDSLHQRLHDQSDQIDDLNEQLETVGAIANQVKWRYDDDRCATCRANNWSACGHVGK